MGVKHMQRYSCSNEKAGLPAPTICFVCGWNAFCITFNELGAFAWLQIAREEIKLRHLRQQYKYSESMASGQQSLALKNEQLIEKWQSHDQADQLIEKCIGLNPRNIEELDQYQWCITKRMYLSVSVSSKSAPQYGNVALIIDLLSLTELDFVQCLIQVVSHASYFAHTICHSSHFTLHHDVSKQLLSQCLTARSAVLPLPVSQMPSGHDHAQLLQSFLHLCNRRPWQWQWWIWQSLFAICMFPQFPLSTCNIVGTWHQLMMLLHNVWCLALVCSKTKYKHQ